MDTVNNVFPRTILDFSERPYIRTPESNHFWHFQVISIEAVHSSQENFKTIPKQLVHNEFHDRSFSFEFERKQ